MARIAITGASGLVGRKLQTHFAAQGHELLTIGRGSKNDIPWDPQAGKLDVSRLEDCDAVVHLAGENIAKRWNAKQKVKIRESREKGTRLLCERLAELQRKPRALVSASAIGYYGDRGVTPCDETTPPGDGFLPEVCIAWENATVPAAQAGIRVVNLRIGVVLSRDGGALRTMLLPFQFGVGGVVGSGDQYFSWITLHDLIMVIDHCVQNESLFGPVNAVAPHPVTNREYTKALGRVLRRPTIFPIPAFAARLAFGEMADALLLASAQVVPQKLQNSGFTFESPEIEGGLRKVLGKTKK